MNQRKAFENTLWLVVERATDDQLKLEPIVHLFEMFQRVTEDFSEAKLGRWLGWAQAVVVMHGLATLDEMKEINRKWA